ncbi:MAG: transposase, partial [Selenomonadaceae bacterium]|nr:transposase [Selenomonadaceae bacterium]
RLVGAIGTMTPTDFSKDPGKHFTRNRKLPFQELLFLKVSSAKGSLPEELRHFHLSKEVSPEDAPSKSSYIQQCGKLSEDAFPTLLHKFNDACNPPALLQGHQLIACDGSGFAFHSDWDWDAYVRGEHGYFAVHFVALYDLISRKYIDAEIQAGRFKNEHEAICNLTDRQKSTNTKKILVADRGFGSYNFYLHAEGIGAFYLVRITESRARSLLGKERFAGLGEPFDVTVTRHLVRHHRKSEYLHQDCLDDYRFISSSTQFDFLKHGESGEIPLTVVSSVSKSKRACTNIWQQTWAAQSSRFWP